MGNEVTQIVVEAKGESPGPRMTLQVLPDGKVHQTFDLRRGETCVRFMSIDELIELPCSPLKPTYDLAL